MEQTVILTIGREYGSGGREIGKKVAQLLNIPFYDNELIALAAKESGMSKEVFEKVDETAASSLLYSIVSGTYMFGNHLGPALDLPINDKLFIAQSDIIKGIAKKGSCVIVGRCADYILKDNPNCINLFVHASLKARVNRATSEYHMPLEKAEAQVLKIDKKRATYYNYYTGEKWGMARNYHLCVDSGMLGIEAAATVVENFVKQVVANRK